MTVTSAAKSKGKKFPFYVSVNGNRTTFLTKITFCKCNQGYDVQSDILIFFKCIYVHIACLIHYESLKFICQIRNQTIQVVRIHIEKVEIS